MPSPSLLPLQLINLRNLEAKQKIVAEVDLMRKLVNLNIINTILTTGHPKVPLFDQIDQSHNENLMARLIKKSS